ncbi:MAG: LamG domain-containing protein [Thermofilaceae archaeon]
MLIILSAIILLTLFCKIMNISAFLIHLLVFLFSIGVLLVLNRRKMSFLFNLYFKFFILTVAIIFSAYFWALRIPRLYNPDETSYIFWSQLFETHNLIPPFGISPYAHDLSISITGRYGWPLYIYMMKFLTGIEFHEIYTCNILSLALLVYASLGILHDLFKIHDEKILLISAVTISFSATNFPIIMTLQNDAIQTYFILVSIYFLFRFLKIDEARFIIRNKGFIMLILCLLHAFLALHLKMNIGLLIAIATITLIVLYKRMRFTDKKYRTLVKALLIIFVIIVAYQLTMDSLRFISYYVFNNWSLANTFARLYLSNPSIIEIVIGSFIELPWDRYTVFSYPFERQLDNLNFAIAPEAQSLLISSTFIALPCLLIFLKTSHKEPVFRILCIGSYLSFWAYFLFLIGANQIHDFTRYAHSIYILGACCAIASLVKLHENEKNQKRGYLIILSFLTLVILVNLFVFALFRGTRFFYDMQRYRFSYALLVPQYIVTTFAILVFQYMNKPEKMFKPRTLILLLLIATLPFVITSTYIAVNNSNLFKETGLKDVREYLLSLNLDDNVILMSNAYIYIRNYVDLTKFIPVPPPATEEEFQEFLKSIPPKSIILLTDLPSISWYEYANLYIKKYIYQDFIPIRYNIKTTHFEPFLEISCNKISTLTTTINIEGSCIRSQQYTGIRLNGSGSYISIHNYSFPDIYTLEILFKIDENPSEFGTYPEYVPWVGGQPVTKSLVAKRYYGYIELMISITSKGAIQVYADNEYDHTRFFILTNDGLINRGYAYHLMLIVDNSTAQLYLNGSLAGLSKISGRNMDLEKVGISDIPLYIGADGPSDFTQFRYLNGTIMFFRIYDKALNISCFYEGLKLLQTFTHDKYMYKVFIKDSLTEHINDLGAQERKINEINAEMKPDGSCAVEFKMSGNASRNLILSTIRFSSVVKVSHNMEAFKYPYSIQLDGSFKLKLANYVCTYFLIIDENNNVYYHMKGSKNIMELFICTFVFLECLILLPIQFNFYLYKKTRGSRIFKHTQ